jgi:hypothetical protein
MFVLLLIKLKSLALLFSQDIKVDFLLPGDNPPCADASSFYRFFFSCNVILLRLLVVAVVDVLLFILL